MLADLGFASDQMDAADRGLSFQHDGPLDMRLDPTAGETAADLVNPLSEYDLADVFYEFGEERHSRRVARRIVETRTADAVPHHRPARRAGAARACRGRRAGIDPATRVFQGLRIAVNDELGALDRLLAAAAAGREAGRAGGDHQLPLAGGPAGEAGVPGPRRCGSR